MKRFFIVFLLLLSSTVFAANAPQIEFEIDSVDFGKVKKKTTLTYVFKFKNTGDSTLVIDDIIAG